MKLQKIENQISLHNNTYLNKSVFFKDTKLEYIFKKTEKISMAIYLVTNFFVPEEPLKWSLRKSATNLLNSVLTYSSSPLSFKEEKNINFHNEILMMVSYLDLAFHSGFISTMNYTILADELDRLVHEIAEYNGDEKDDGEDWQGDESEKDNNQKDASKGLFVDNYFEVQKSLRTTDNIMSYRNEANLYKGQEKRQSNNQKDITSISNDENVKTNFRSGNSNTKFENINIKTDNPKKTKRTSEENLQRQEKILDEIGRIGEVSIKDIENVLPKYSSKTLQRELLRMVEIGLLDKKGERRWSRYSLKKS